MTIAFGIHNLDRTAAQAFFTKIFAGTENINMNTRSISGHKYFTAWEWEVTFNYIKPVEEVAHEEGFEPDKADGRRMRLVAVDLLWWNDDGKIVKDHTYSKMILV
jgi:poly(3-hydroxyalkanoate) synthetase